MAVEIGLDAGAVAFPSRSRAQRVPENTRGPRMVGACLLP